MTYRERINYSPQQKAEIWDRWQQGDSLNEIGVLACSYKFMID